MGMNVIPVHYRKYIIHLGIRTALPTQIVCGRTSGPHCPTCDIFMGTSEGTRTQDHWLDVLRFLRWWIQTCLFYTCGSHSFMRPTKVAFRMCVLLRHAATSNVWNNKTFSPFLPFLFLCILFFFYQPSLHHALFFHFTNMTNDKSAFLSHFKAFLPSFSLYIVVVDSLLIPRPFTSWSRKLPHMGLMTLTPIMLIVSATEYQTHFCVHVLDCFKNILERTHILVENKGVFRSFIKYCSINRSFTLRLCNLNKRHS